MGTQITTVEVFECALVLTADERARLAAQLLLSLEGTAGSELGSGEQILERFKALDARFVAAVACEVERLQRSGEQDDLIGSERLA